MSTTATITSKIVMGAKAINGTTIVDIKRIKNGKLSCIFDDAEMAVFNANGTLCRRLAGARQDARYAIA